MLSSRFRGVAALISIALGLTRGQAQAQSLRFALPITKVDAARGSTNAENALDGPTGVAVDAAGDLYIADTKNMLVRKVSPTQTATIFAGKGIYGYAGDHGPAISATLKTPTAVAVDPSGNVYISDPASFAVRKVDPSGIITTFAGGNGSGSSGDGGPATAARIVPAGLAADSFGNIYIVDTFANTVRIVSSANVINTYAGGGSIAGDAGNEGPALLAQFNSPSDIAMSSAGNLYVNDYGNSTVRMVDKLGVIHAFAGTTGVSGSTGDGGPAVNATLAFPTGITIDPAGNVYLTGSDTVRVVNAAGIISVIVGAGYTAQVLDDIPADAAPISIPQGLAADKYGHLFLSVPFTNDVFAVNLHPELFPQTKIGTSSQPQRIIVENYGPASIKFSSLHFSGDFGFWSFTLPQNRQCMATTNLTTGAANWCTLDVVFTPTAEGVRSFPLTITSNDVPGTLTETLTSTGLGSSLAMTSGLMYTVAGRYNPGFSSPPTSTGPATSISISQPSGLTVDSSGNIYFSESAFCLVERVDGATGIMSIYGGTNAIPCQPNDGHTIISGDGGAATAAYIPGPGPLALDSQNNLYIADPFDGRIRRIDTAGNVTTFAGNGVGVDYSSSCQYTPDGKTAIQSGLCGVASLAFDSAGNLYFVESGTNLIRRISTAGILSTVAGTFSGSFYAGGFAGDGGPATSARFNEPQGLAIDSAGNIYICDTGNQVVRKVTAATGMISTIAGQQGVLDYTGDGGPALNATFNFPQAISLDAAGDLFIADYQNWVVRKIDTAGVITTVAGNHLSELYNGEGFPATESNLSFPAFVVNSPGGHLFLTDKDNQLIREVSPNASLVFQPRDIGTTSVAQSIAISNIGNTPMHFDSQAPTAITGDFAIASGGTCDFTATMPVGANCTVNVTFKPSAFGPRSGIFAFYDDGVASPQYVALGGNGVGAQPQAIRFPGIANHTYGDADFAIVASSNSALPVVFSVKSGNAVITGSTVHITGIGPVMIAADQAGSADSWLAAAEVTQSFSIAPAALLVTAQNATSVSGAALVPLTYAITGFVYNENAGVVSGAPVLSSAVTPSTPVGTYPISVAPGTLAAANYTFVPVNGQYTVTPYRIPAPPVVLSAAGAITRSDTYQVTVTVTNTGSTAAQNVVLTSVKLNSIAGGPAPKVLGVVAAGGSVTVTVSIPLSAGASKSFALMQIAGTYAGGSFGSTSRVTLP